MSRLHRWVMLFLLGLFASLLLVAPAPRSAEAAACTKTWNNAGGGTWSTAANWTPAGVPGTTDVVCLPHLGATYSANVLATTTVKEVQVSAGGGLGGPILRIVSTGSTTRLHVTTLVTNAGRIELTSSSSGEASLWPASMNNTSQGVLVSQAGAGGVRTVVSGTITNAGNITISQPTEFTGVLTHTGAMVLNANLFHLISSAALTVHQNGGSIQGAGTLSLGQVNYNYNSGSVTAPTSLFNTLLTMSDSATGTATFTLEGALGQLAGTIPPGATVVIQGRDGFNGTVTGTTPITNNGTLKFSSVGAASLANLVAGLGLTNNGTLASEVGAGGQRVVAGALVNSGTLTVNHSMSLEGPGLAHTNSGNGTLAIGTTLTLSGAGSALANSGTISGPGTLVLTSTTLTGTGSVTNTLLNGTASVGPGASPGLLTMSASYSHSAGTSLNVELGGLGAGVGFDQLAVAGNVILTGGILNVSLSNGFVPCSGTTFDVVTYGTRTGTFATVNGLNLGAGHNLTVTYLPNALRLTTVGGPTCSIGGRNLSIVANPAALELAWDGGNLQSSYMLLQYNTATTAATLIALPGNATSYIDLATSSQTIYCYVLVPLGPGPLGFSDLLCGERGLSSGTVVASNFKVTLNQSASATLTWVAPPGGADSYLLQRIPLNGAAPTAVGLPGGATSSLQAVVAAGTCFQLVGFKGVAFGVTNLVCGIPGVGNLGGESAGASRTAAHELEAVMPQLAGVAAAVDRWPNPQ